MKPIFWKELQQWWKLALGGFLAVAALHYSFLKGIAFWPANILYQSRDLTILGYQILNAVVAAIAGLVLGFAQVYPETHRDQWAFLVFRPLSRTHLFLGKTLAGLVLYTVWAFLPWALAVGWIAWPGHVPAPFEIAMVYPGLIDLAAGLAFYFASMIMALRPARWLGSRTWPILASLLGALILSQATTAIGAAIACLIGVTVLGLTAWGCFHQPEDIGRRPAVARLAFVLTLSAGGMVIVTFGVICLQILSQVSRPESEWTSYTLRNDGTLYKVRQSGSQLIEAHDLDGRPFPFTSKDGRIGEFYLAMMPSARIHFHPSTATQPGAFRRRDHFYVEVPRPNEFGERWVYRMSDHRIHGYDLTSKRHIGSIGPKGFTANGTEPAAADHFDTKGNLVLEESGMRGYPGWMSVLPSSNQLFSVFVESREVRRVLTLDPDASLLKTSLLTGDQTGSFVVHTGKRIHIRSLGNGDDLVLPAPSTGNKPDSIQVGISKDDVNGSVIVWSGTPTSPPDLSAGTLRHYDRLGNLISSRHVAKIENPSQSEPFGRQIAVCSLPPIIVLAASVFEGSYLAFENPAITTLFCLTLALLLVATHRLLHQSGACSRERLGWFLTVLFGGVAGVLALLALRDDTATAPCPHCGKLRLLKSPACSHCAPSANASQRNATEIFADLQSLPDLKACP